MANPEKRKKAQALRRQGWRIKDIAKEINIRRDTVSKWCRDIELTPEQIDTLAAKDPHWLVRHNAAQQTKKDALKQRIAYQEAGRQRAKEATVLHLKACMLYWGEGAKGRNNLQFTNTDPHMLRLFMRFLRQEFNVSDSNIYLRIMHHTKDKQEINRIESYWLDWLNLSSDCTVKMQVKEGTKSRKTRYQNGICAIGVSSTEIQHHIFGAIQEYLGFDNPDWLK